MPSAIAIPSLGERRTWSRVRFGEVVENVTRTTPDPVAAGLERYVGLEHLDPRGLLVQRWGAVAEGTTFTRHFCAGEVLFGKRRAYQRKAALAEFDGVCSGDLLVFRARTGALLPTLLPYIVQSDLFVKHALGTSAGSLSPRTRWKDLADFEFLLPPDDVQRRLASLLEATFAVGRRWDSVECSALALERARVRAWLERQAPDVSVPLGDVVTDVKYGTSVRCGDNGTGTTPVLRIPNVVSWRLDTAELKWAALEQNERSAYAVAADDLLMVRTNGNPAYVGRCALIPELDQRFAFASYLLRLRFERDRVLPRYMWMLFQQPATRRAMAHLIRSSAGNYNLSASGLSSLRVPVPGLAEQARLVGAVEEVAALTRAAAGHRRDTDALLLAIENELVSA